MGNPTVIKGKRVVRLREVRTQMPPFVMVTWGVFDLHGRTKLHASATRVGAAAWATEQGYVYVGRQEPGAVRIGGD